MTPRRPFRIVGLAVAATLAVGACGGGDTTTDPTPDLSAETTAADTTTADTTTDTTSGADVTGPPVSDSSSVGEQPDATVGDVPEVLQLSAPLVGGGDLDLAGFAGRPVALWFWAPG